MPARLAAPQDSNVTAKLTVATVAGQALATEGGFAFLNVRASVVMDQFFGNSNKRVAAVFSLAAKLEPCIVFIGADAPAPDTGSVLCTPRDCCSSSLMKLPGTFADKLHARATAPARGIHEQCEISAARLWKTCQNVWE